MLLKPPVDLDSSMSGQGFFASLPHPRLPALTDLDQTKTQDVGVSQNSPNAGREAPEEDWKARFRVDAFATAQTNQIHC
jgi:hypothetical protein